MSKLEKNILKFLDLMTNVTVRITSFDEEGHLIGRCSGFLYKKTLDSIPIVITAGHKLPQKGSFIETKIVKDGKILQINAGEFKVFYNNDDIDYAYSELPIAIYQEEMEQYEGVSFAVYNHEFIAAEQEEAYGFSVVNDYLEFVERNDITTLPSYSCYELGLELVKQEEHVNYFKPQIFQGDEFYRGASGSPIADPEGIITSILIGGTEDGLLCAFRLDNIKLE